jgi:hypothetical protein
MASRQVDRERLASELAGLNQLGLADLRERWLALYGQQAPTGFRTQLLIQGIGFKLQEKAFGGLKSSTRRLLARIADGEQPAPVAPVGRAGTVLIREWHGKSHQVHVLEDGVSFQGRRYASLSAVAREITGARWSGPAFFGLKSRGLHNVGR